MRWRKKARSQNKLPKNNTTFALLPLPAGISTSQIVEFLIDAIEYEGIHAVSTLISKVLRDKPVHEAASAVKTMLDAGFDKMLILQIVYHAGTVNSVFMANFAYTMLASGIDMSPKLANMAHVICLRSKQHLPRTIDTVKVFIHALKACGCDREFNWSCLESAFSFLYIDHPNMDNFTHADAIQLSLALYIANAWMIEDFKGTSFMRAVTLNAPNIAAFSVSMRAVALNAAILSNLFQFKICPLHNLSHDWIVVLDRYLRQGKVDLHALNTVITFVKNRGSAHSFQVGLHLLSFHYQY